VSKKVILPSALLSAASLVFALVFMAFAGMASAATYTPGLHSNVVNSVHNLEVQDNLDDVCTECHLPHGANASAGYLWAQAPQTVALATGQSSDIISLCYSCHDGTGGTTIGDDTVFANSTTTGATIHPLTSYENNKNKGGKDCDRCHDPHEDSTQRPNFIRYYQFGSTTKTMILGPDVCASCHSGNVSGNTPHGASAPANDHPIDANGSITMAVSKGSVINPNMVVYDPSTTTPTPGTRMFAPLFTPTPTAPAAAGGSPDLGGANRYDQVNKRASGNPVDTLLLGTITATGTPTDAQVKCESCHAPHGPLYTDLLTDDPNNGTLCSNCHQ